MSQYFENDRDLKRDPRSLTCWCGTKKLSFETDSGVFSRNEIDDASLLLVRNIPQINGNVLELGCGYGFMGIYSAVRNPGIVLTQTDVNERAVELCRKNCTANSVISNVLVSDGFQALDGRFDTVLFNPPIHAGKETVYRLADEALNHLADGGNLYIVIRKKHGAASMMDHLKERSSVEILKKEKDIYLLSCCLPAQEEST